MSTKSAVVASRIVKILGASWTWRIVVGLFVLESVWLVVSAQYPMAFDENYHFGLIKLHAQQWLPFFTHQPAHAGMYGAIVRDPSYLYHWILSFPYRLVSLFTNDQVIQIISLRLCNVGFFVGALYLYRKVVRRAGASQALTNSLFAVFILIPVVPFLAAHINYDNLLVLAVPLAALLALQLLDGLANRCVDARALLCLALVLLLGGLIKYPFLPVLVVLVVFLLWRLRRTGMLNSRGWHSFVESFWQISRPVRVLLVAAVVVASALFTERYGVNIVRYHSPVPACDAVISLQECLEYGPFYRDYGYVSAKSASFHPNLPSYMWQWFEGMWYRLFFAINYNYFSNPPLFIISRTAVVMAIALFVGVVVKWRALFAGNAARQLLLLLVTGYLLVLFADGFQSYMHTGMPVAINGRYLIPFLPFIFVLGGIAWSHILRGRQAARAALASVVIAVFVLQGGGTMTYIVRGADDWFWPSPAIRSINREIRNVVSPVIIGKNV